MLAMESIEQMDAHIAHELAHRHLFEFVDDDFFALCARRNALTPFCRLSEDILIQIINNLQDLCFQAHVKPRYSRDWFTWSLPGPDVAQWTQVNLVCSRIRQLTAGTMELWRVWNLDTPLELQSCISNRIPHVLYAYGTKFLDGDYESTLDAVRPHIQHLSLVLKRTHAKDLAHQLVASGRPLTHDMHKIEGLEIICSVIGLDITQIMHESVSTILTSLKVVGIALANQLPFTHLRTLEWHFTPRQGDQLRFAQLIASAPNLERVYFVQTGLWTSMDRVFSVSASTEPAAKLASLHTIALHGSSMIVDGILRLIPHPSTNLYLRMSELLPSGSYMIMVPRVRALMTSSGLQYTLLVTATHTLCKGKYRLVLGATEHLHLKQHCWPENHSPLIDIQACSISGIIHFVDQLQLDRMAIEPGAAAALMNTLEWRECTTLHTLKHADFINAENNLRRPHSQGHLKNLMDWLRHRKKAKSPIQTLSFTGLRPHAISIRDLQRSGLTKTIVTESE